MEPATEEFIDKVKDKMAIFLILAVEKSKMPKIYDK